MSLQLIHGTVKRSLEKLGDEDGYEIYKSKRENYKK